MYVYFKDTDFQSHYAHTHRFITFSDRFTYPISYIIFQLHYDNIRGTFLFYVGRSIFYINALQWKNIMRA